MKKINNSKLIAYSAVAGAVLATAPNAIAQVVHQTVDIPFGNAFGIKDLTMEGINAEFNFFGDDNYFGVYGNSECFIYKNATGTHYQIKAIPSGQKVNYLSNAPSVTIGAFSYYSYGSWSNDNDTNYCGISFKLENGNQTNVYGWLQVVRLSQSEGRVIAWAYESSGAGITVGAIPEPVTGLALLALGAAGIARYRKK